MKRFGVALAALMLVTAPGGDVVGVALAQTPPNKSEIFKYKSLLSAVIRENIDETRQLLASGADPNMTDDNGRTPLIVTAHRSQAAIARALVAGGANANAKDKQHYDIVTIAAVNDDVVFLKVALALGCQATNITSPYNGTALIAAAHLGHHRSVAELIMAGAPLDHVNNLGMTALIEAIVLGDGGANHQATARLLLGAGANPNLGDRSGASPLTLARSRGYGALAEMISRAGGK